MKVQHALRAFTAKDRKMIKLVAENYPVSEYYDIETMLTSLGIGEAAVTVLNEKGNPTPLAAVLLCPPKSRMDVLEQSEIDSIVASSRIVSRYNESIDRESAYEILNKKLESASSETQEKEESSKGTKEEKTTFEKVITSSTARSIGTTVAREITRGILGVLGFKSRRR